ncbi:hypothetical protein [Kingella sp. (in: b-proteobacteria)]|uniref:hypothetical protein n=1 Tax=Kingella sp. (in: b-proteobacteria) TaxID=2020713 RepID=UPI0026DC5D80|nr:hypothetical protein [Kingella sp. (in: b-proteobacteria)]MDO4656355.1 hypothetical protein [Kingella sp. (in: b-proteobacteria)]
MNIGRDSRLRGNDGISCFQAAFCVAGDGGMAWMGWFQGCLKRGCNRGSLKTLAPRSYGLLASRALAK